MNISIILAAGEGSRMKSSKPKVIHEICGKPLLQYVIDASKKAGIEKNYCIIGHGAKRVKDAIREDENVEYRLQPVGEDAPYGTGYALMQAEDAIEDENTVLILYGDTPLISEKTIKDLLNYHELNKNDGTVLTASVEDPTGYGRIIRDTSGEVLKIVEEKDALEEEKLINEINSGIYVFNGELLKKALGELDNNNAQNEYYATDIVKILKDAGKKLGAYKMKDSLEIHGINSKVQLSFCEKIMRRRINERLMTEGAILVDPESTYIDDTVRIGRDTVVYPGSVLKGETTIGENTVIKENTRIENSFIGEEVEICSSVIEDSEVGNKCKIGPNAHLRPNTRLGENIKIGNFVEIKNSSLGNNTKVSHLAYVGDAEVGKDVNIGCGVVFVNYNGHEKFKSIIRDKAFIGSNSNIVAPVTVEEYGYIAAGSTITDDVEELSLAIARARQSNKIGWVKEKGLNK